MSVARAPFRLGGVTVAPGRRGLVELPSARLITGGQAALPVRVIHGRNDGATIWLSAAIHGDEIVGVLTVDSVKAAGVHTMIVTRTELSAGEEPVCTALSTIVVRGGE